MDMFEDVKKQKWVVAVSGGSDSMALLHMCVKANVPIVIAHVNYQKRETADRDMKGVEAFAKRYQIPYFVMRVEKYKEKENFQLQAREIRYRFFAEVVKENDCAGVLVAHHKDDVLETYIMQKQSNRIPTQYGIVDEISIYGVLVKRVLLQYTKAQLEKYCVDNNLTYYTDESNLSDTYERNRVRHHVLANLSEDEKQRLWEEMQKANTHLNEVRNKATLFVEENKERLPLASFLKFEKEEQVFILRNFIKQYIDKEISKKTLLELCKMLSNHNKQNATHTISETVLLRKEYGYVYVDMQESQDFAYVLNSIEYIKTPFFEICNAGEKIEGVYVCETDFPLTIRNAKEGDEIKLRLGTKKVNRFFIDRKISFKQRKCWPLIENKDGNVIFVCGIGCDIYHYSNNYSFFVLK